MIDTENTTNSAQEAGHKKTCEAERRINENATAYDQQRLKRFVPEWLKAEARGEWLSLNYLARYTEAEKDLVWELMFRLAVSEGSLELIRFTEVAMEQMRKHNPCDHCNDEASYAESVLYNLCREIESGTWSLEKETEDDTATA